METTKKINQDWVLTDSDSNQYGRQITKTLFEFKQDGKEATLIDLKNYPKKEIEHTINSFGYTLMKGENRVKTLQNIYFTYGASSNWIIAECIFESE